MVAKTKALEAEVEEREATIERWGVHSAELKKQLDVAEARVRNWDRDLEAARDEEAKLKRSAKAEKEMAVLAARKASSL